MIEENEYVKETRLPRIVETWRDSSLTYSRFNDIPAMLGYYALLGDIVKHFVEIPYKNTTTDTRIHWVNIQTARSGKTTLVNYVLKPIAEEVYKEIKRDEKEFNNKILKLSDYTTAALIGSYRDNKEVFVEDEERRNKIFFDEVARLGNLLGDATANPPIAGEITQEEHNKGVLKAEATRFKQSKRWIEQYGPLHGEGLWFADEFEHSGIFKTTAHKEGMHNLFQDTMNNFHTGSNKHEKILAGKVGINDEPLVIALDSKFTIMGFTYPPSGLLKTIAEKGVLQRMILFIWNVPNETLENMRGDVIGGFGTIAEQRGPPLHLSKGIVEIYKQVKRRFNDNGKDRQSTVKISSSATDALKLEHRNFLKYIEHLNPSIYDVVRLFEMNLMEYIGKLAVLNCISMAPSIVKEEDKFIVQAQHVRQGAYIIRKCYIGLIEWLENSLKLTKQSITGTPMFKQFQQAYEVAINKANPQDKLEGGHVWKKLLLQEASKISGHSYVWTNKNFNKLNKEDMFETISKGKTRYVKPKEA